jgi:glycopeptide antibiotics resistance protein
MTKVLKLGVSIINKIHDLIVDGVDMLGLKLTDKQLHFWMLGLIGVVIFAIFDILFKKIAKWSISAITFIYTFTVLVVLVLAIEIEQEITKAGSMEFEDLIAGLSGFVLILLLYMLFRIIYRELRK